MRAMRIGIGLIIGISMQASLFSAEWQMTLQQPVGKYYAPPQSLQLLQGTLPLFTLSPELLNIDAWEQRILREPISIEEMQVWDAVIISWRMLGIMQQDIHSSCKILPTIVQAKIMYLRLTCGKKIPFHQIQQAATKLIKAISCLQLIRKDVYQPAHEMVP